MTHIIFYAKKNLFKMYFNILWIPRIYCTCIILLLQTSIEFPTITIMILVSHVSIERIEHASIYNYVILIYEINELFSLDVVLIAIL